MAMLPPLHHEFPCKDHVFHNGTSSRQSRGELMFGSRHVSSGKTLPCPALDVLRKAEVTSSSTNGLKHRTMTETNATARDCWTKSRIRSIPRGKLCVVRASSETKTIKKRLKLLDSYFGKLQTDDEKQPSSLSATGDEIDRNAQVSADEELKSLSAYLDKPQKDAMVKSESGLVASKSRKADLESKNSLFQKLDDDDDDQSEDTLSFYAVSVLASINVGVCLFEAASPVRNNEMGLLSLPLLYGAKINDLIVAGEWWRLVTPMFLVQDQQIGSVYCLKFSSFHCIFFTFLMGLVSCNLFTFLLLLSLQHSGVPHVALSSWALLTFGPKVCRDYGLLTFCLVYILGGVSGNFMSFLHTPDPTVGGTGPAFALIGAWLVDQSQNKEMIKRDEYDDLFQKAIIMSGLGLILSHFGPIDDWTNLGALVTGIVYGFFTCPVFQLGGGGGERQEGIVAVGPEKPNSADPCKSFLVFVVFVAVLVTSVILLGDGPLDFPTYDDVVYSLI